MNKLGYRLHRLRPKAIVIKGGFAKLDPHSIPLNVLVEVKIRTQVKRKLEKIQFARQYYVQFSIRDTPQTRRTSIVKESNNCTTWKENLNL